MPDTLSRLPVDDPHPDTEVQGGLDKLPDETSEHLAWAFAGDTDTQPVEASTMVEMSPEFRIKITQGYRTDPRWSKIMAEVQRNSGLSPNAAKLLYEIRKGLLWRVSDDSQPRLCVPDSCVMDVFQLMHDGSHHGYAKLSNLLTSYCVH